MHSIIDCVKYNMSILMTWAYIFFSQKKNRTILMRKKDTDISRSDYVFKSRQFFLQGHKKSHLIGLAFLCPTLPKKTHFLTSTFFHLLKRKVNKLQEIVGIFFLPCLILIFLIDLVHFLKIVQGKKKQYFSTWGVHMHICMFLVKILTNIVPINKCCQLICIRSSS